MMSSNVKGDHEVILGTADGNNLPSWEAIQSKDKIQVIILRHRDLLPYMTYILFSIKRNKWHINWTGESRLLYFKYSQDASVYLDILQFYEGE